MQTISQDAEQHINQSVNNLIRIFKKWPNVFLTEEDVRCHLSYLLFPFFGHPLTTEDGKVSVSLHAQVRWYGRSQDMRKLSDLVLIDVNDLRVDAKGRFPVPTKGYGFNNFFAAFELKLRRANNSVSNNKLIKNLQKDLETLKYLKNGINNKYSSLLFLIALDKQEDISSKIEELNKDAESESIKVVYEFARESKNQKGEITNPLNF